MSTRLKTYIFLLAAVLLGGGGYYVSGKLTSSAGKSDESSTKPQDEDADAIPVAIEAAARGAIADELTSTANLRARREVAVATRAAGIVTAVKVEEGDFVRAGQVLCALDDRELRINLALAEQRLAQTRIQLEAARIRKEQTQARLGNKGVELQRNEDALSQGLLAESEVAVQRHEIEDLEHEVRVVESTVRENLHRIDELQAEIERAKLLISQTAITAPFAGRITERTVELGQSVRVADRLYKLSSFSPLYADIYLPENESRRAAPGQRVRFRLGIGDGEDATGEVERVSPVVDGETGTVKVTARFEAPSPAFRPGAFVRVEIETDTRSDAVLIPKQAVMEEDGESYVVLVDEDRLAKRVAVELGYRAEAAVEVTSGVSEGDSVVVAGQGKLKDGDKTRVISN